MKMYEVFELIAKGKIEPGAKLKVVAIFEDEYEYEYINDIRAFLDEEYNEFGERFDMNTSFLNYEAHLEQPSKQKYKYRIKLPHSDFYMIYVEKDEKTIMFPFSLNDSFVEKAFKIFEEAGAVIKTEFTEQDFVEIEELQTYEKFRELVKDDEK